LAVDNQRPKLYVSVTLSPFAVSQTNKQTKMMLFECKAIAGGATVSSSGHRFHCLPPLQLTKSPLVSVHPQSISCFHAKLFFKSNRFSFVPVRAADSSTTATSQSSSSSDVPLDSRTLVPDDEISITKVKFFSFFIIIFF